MMPMFRRREIQVPFQEIVWRAAAVTAQGVFLLGFLLVQVDAVPQYGADSGDGRAVRVVTGLAGRMVFAVHRDPLPGRHASGQPEPEPEEVLNQRIQAQSAVSLLAVQEKRHRHNGDVGQPQNQEEIAPYRQQNRPCQKAISSLVKAMCGSGNQGSRCSRILPYASTSTRQLGETRIVAVSSRMMAGPFTVCPTASSARE